MSEHDLWLERKAKVYMQRLLQLIFLAVISMPTLALSAGCSVWIFKAVSS